jgi:hypothetical protein
MSLGPGRATAQPRTATAMDEQAKVNPGLATNRLHFEPVESACGLRRSRQTIVEGRVDSVRRGSDHFDHA